MIKANGPAAISITSKWWAFAGKVESDKQFILHKAPPTFCEQSHTLLQFIENSGSACSQFQCITKADSRVKTYMYFAPINANLIYEANRRISKRIQTKSGVMQNSTRALN